MKTKFEKFIEENYKGLNFISIQSEAIEPGVILNDDDRIIDDLSRIFPDEIKWKTIPIAASISNLTVNGERNLDLGISVLGMIGLKGNGGFNSGYSVSFEFSEVSEVVFDTENGGAYENEVRTMIQKLKNTDRNAWFGILHKFVTMEVLIVKSATVEFKKDGKVIGDVDLPMLHNALSINGSYNWIGSGKMVVNNDKSLPFGVLGFQIKRSM